MGRDAFVQFVVGAILDARAEMAEQAVSLPPGDGNEERRLHLAGQWVGLTTALEIIQGYRDPEEKEL